MTHTKPLIALDSRHVLDPHTGLVVNRGTRRIVDVHNAQVRSSCHAKLQQFSDLLSPVYDHGYLIENRTNCIDHSGSLQLLDLVDVSAVYQCPCLRFAYATKTASKNLEEHFALSKDCERYLGKMKIAKGAVFRNDQRDLIYVILNGKKSRKARASLTAKMEVDEPAMALVVTKDTETERLNEFVADVLARVNKISVETDDFFQHGADIMRPRGDEIIDNYLYDRKSCEQLLPYILLDCITDDLWNEDHSITSSFRFLLNTIGPELVLFDQDKTLEIKIHLANTGPHWRCDIGVASLNQSSKFKRRDQIKFDNLTLYDVAEILLTLRGVVNALLDRLYHQAWVPQGAQLTDYITQCLNVITQGPGLSMKALRRQLSFHATRLA